MVKKSHLKWSLILPFLLLLLAAIGIAVYILLPTVLSALISNPQGGDVCSPQPTPSGSLQEAMTNLCTDSKSLLGVGIMLLIVLSGLLGLVPMALVIIDAFCSPLDGTKKALWIIGTMLFGYFAAALYYFVEVRKRKD